MTIHSPISALKKKDGGFAIFIAQSYRVRGAHLGEPHQITEPRGLAAQKSRRRRGPQVAPE